MSDMKLIMEGWRGYCAEPVSAGRNFDILYENYSKGRISHIQLYESWDRQVITEAQALLDEGVLDVLKRGAEAIAAGAKEEWEIIKFAYNEAAKKVSDFIFNIEIQAWKLIQDGKIILSKIAATLMKGVKFIKKFCGVQPVLCKATLAFIVMISITAVMAVMASPAMAQVDVPATDGGKGYFITDTGVKAIKGCLEVITRETDPESQQHAVDAVEWLNKAHEATTSTELQATASKAQEYVNVCYQVVKKSAEEDPSLVGQLAKHGEQVVTLTNKYYKAINGVTIDNIEWQSLAEPGMGNVSPLAPQNIGRGAKAALDALK